MPILLARDVTVKLRDLPVIDSLSVQAEPGEMIGLIGPNGAGKTTLIRALCGLLPFTGTILIDGTPVAKLPPRRRAQNLSYLPQDHTAHWPLSVGEIVRLARLPFNSWNGSGLARDNEAVDRALSRCGITNWAQRPITELSAGERARVHLARALAVEAPILLVDEPTAALDPHFQLHIMDVLRAIADEGTLVVSVLHDLNLAARHCDRLLLLAHGKAMAAGKPDEVLTEKNLADIYRIAATHGSDEAGAFVIPRRRLT